MITALEGGSLPKKFEFWQKMDQFESRIQAKLNIKMTFDFFLSCVGQCWVGWQKKFAESDCEVVHFLSIWVALPITAYCFNEAAMIMIRLWLVLMSKSDIFFPEQISFRFVKYAGQHMCVCLFNSTCATHNTKSFFFQRGAGLLF